MLMKRILIDYKKLNHEVATLLIETYPDGYGDEDIISFRNVHGEFVEAVENRFFRQGSHRFSPLRVSAGTEKNLSG